MKYLVNRKTKEHRIAPAVVPPEFMGRWVIVQADAEGWIKWDQSSKCPVPAESRVEIKNNNNKICPFPIAAHQYYWKFIGSYRPILDKPEATAKGSSRAG